MFHLCNGCRKKARRRDTVIRVPEFGLTFHPACFVTNDRPQLVRRIGAKVTIKQPRMSSITVRDPRAITATGGIAHRETCVS